MAVFNKIYDPFNNTSLNINLWTTFTSGAGSTVSLSGGNLVLHCATVTVADSQVSTTLYNDLTSSYAMANFVQAGNSSGGVTNDTVLRLNDSSGNNALYMIIGGTSLTAYKYVNSVETSVGSATYNSTTMAYLRIRESSGVTYWEYSSSPDVAFTEITHQNNPIDVTKISAKIELNEWLSDALVTDVLVGSFNVPAPSYPGNAFRSISVGNGMSRNEGAT